MWRSCAARWKARAVVLGSATPSLESYHNCKQGKYGCWSCRSGRTTRRCRWCGSWTCARRRERGSGIPHFLAAARGGHRSSGWSGSEQSILFLNRRGYATLAAMPDVRLCGAVPELQRVPDLPPATSRSSCCHICGHDRAGRRPSVRTASAGIPQIRFAGLGTQKVEETLQQAFPARAQSSAWTRTR